MDVETIVVPAPGFVEMVGSDVDVVDVLDRAPEVDVVGETTAGIVEVVVLEVVWFKLPVTIVDRPG